MMLPVAIQMAKRSKTSPSVFLMPMAFGSLLGGLATLIGTSPNIIVETMRVYWERQWNYAAAALRGSSYYRLPKVLQWISGNIGFHHIHHLSPRIPNYNLQKSHESDPRFAEVTAISLRSSLKSLKFRFWDEEAKELVGYAHLRKADADQRANRSAKLNA